MTGNRQASRERPGFTLIELLVVVAIIAILVSMGAGAYLRYISTQKERNTRALLQKLHTAVSQQWSKEYYEIEAEKQPIPSSFLSMASGNTRLARILWYKFKCRASFPMTYEEALNPVVGSSILQPSELRPFAPYVAGLRGRTGAIDPTTESAACLLLALQRPRGGM
jgi:prepilin-type N-terminal cleavage/methylation domain-containing protein